MTRIAGMEDQHEAGSSLGGDVVRKLVVTGAASTVFFDLERSAGLRRERNQIVEPARFGIVKSPLLIHFLVSHSLGGGKPIQIAHNVLDATACSREHLRKRTRRVWVDRRYRLVYVGRRPRRGCGGDQRVGAGCLGIAQCGFYRVQLCRVVTLGRRDATQAESKRWEQKQARPT